MAGRALTGDQLGTTSPWSPYISLAQECILQHHPGISPQPELPQGAARGVTRGSSPFPPASQEFHKPAYHNFPSQEQNPNFP